MSKKIIIPILFLLSCLTTQGQSMLGYTPYDEAPQTPQKQGTLGYKPYNNDTSQKQTTYTVRMTGYTYDVISEELIKIPIKIQVIEKKNNDYYKFIAYKTSYSGWCDKFIGTPTIYNVSKRDNLYEYFDYYVTISIGKIYFNVE